MSMAKWVQTIMYAQGIQGPYCGHSLLHDYVRYFFKDQHVVTVDYEIAPPLHFATKKQLKLDNDWREETGRQGLVGFPRQK